MLLFATVGWILAAKYTNSLYAGAFVFVLLTISGSLTELWNSVILNAHVRSKDRATALSTLSFLVQIPYVLVVIVFAQSIENQSLDGFYFMTGLILAFATIAYYLVDHPRRKIKKS